MKPVPQPEQELTVTVGNAIDRTIRLTGHTVRARVFIANKVRTKFGNVITYILPDEYLLQVKDGYDLQELAEYLNSFNQINVYRVNEYEWWAARSLGEAVTACAYACELPEDDATDEPYQLSVADLETHIMLDEDGTPLHSFAEALQELRENYSDIVPRYFARYFVGYEG